MTREEQIEDFLSKDIEMFATRKDAMRYAIHWADKTREDIHKAG